MKLGWRIGAALALVIAPALAQAGPVSFLAPSAGETLAGGSIVTVRWTGVPSRARELELLLSVDGGRSRVRIGREVEGDETSLTWTVPNLPAARAILYVRFGGNGMEETVGGASAPFTIVPAAGTPLPSLGHRDGELWIGPEARSIPLDPSAFGAPDGAFVAATRELVLWKHGGAPHTASLDDATEPPAGGSRSAPRAPPSSPRPRQAAAPTPLRV